MLNTRKLQLYLDLCDDEELQLNDLPTVFENMWVHNGAVDISNETLLLLNLEDRYPKFRSLVIRDCYEPTVTKRTTLKLMDDYRQKNCADTMVVKEFLFYVYGKNFYKRPYLAPDSLFIPLQGETVKNVDYLNLAMVDEFYALDKENTVVLFCNNLEIVLPLKTGSVTKIADKYLKHYTVYFECDNQYKVDLFSNWQGSYHQQKKSMLEKELNQLKNKNTDYIKSKCKFMYYSSESDIAEVIDNYYDYQ